MLARLLLVLLLLLPGLACAQSMGGQGQAFVIAPGTNLSAGDVTATGSTTARTTAQRAADVINVKDYGAVCDDSTDDATAINAAFTQLRTNQHNGPSVWWGSVVFPQGKACRINSAINMTGLGGGAVEIEGNGATIDCHATGAICLDALSSRYLHVHNLTVVGDATDEPKIGLQIGRITPTGSADNHGFHDIMMWGNFSQADVYNLASESIVWENVRLYNADPGTDGYALIEDGFNHWNASSTFVTETITPDTSLSFNKNIFIGLDTLRSVGTGPSIWLGKTSGHEFISSYVGKSTAGTAVVLYGENGFQNTDLRAEIHMETSAQTDAFLVTGTDAAQTIHGFTYKDFLNVSSNSILKADTGVTSVSLQGADIRIESYGNTATLFDTSGHAASIWNVSGSYQSSTLAQFNVQGGGVSTGAFWKGPVRIGAVWAPNALYGYDQGYLTAQIPDSTSWGGNARGTNSVDWQTRRSQPTQVASGANSANVGGNGNTCSGQTSVCGGTANVASNTSGVVFGQSNTASGLFSSIAGGRQAADRGYYGRNCFASNDFAAQGDAQTCFVVMRGTGATGSAFRLTSDQAAAGSVNCLNIPANTAYKITVDIMAFDHTTPANNEEWGTWSGLLTRAATAGSTAVKLDTTPTPQTNGTVTGSAIAATADTTNACLNISFTPPTSNTDTWNVVARVQTVEVQ